ncbi:MAG: hypothetical protein QOJ02_2179 [Acidobacteriota bacterium]|nr:hypothetical protein [Acidobacteriota bacterium]
MSTSRELISNALKERFREVCDEPRLSTAASGPANFFQDVRQKLYGISPADARKLISYPRGLDYWTTSDAGFRRSLLALSLGHQTELRPSEQPPVALFMKLLAASRADPQQRTQLLAERYGSPLNFTLPSEDEAREYVLMRLMTHDRAGLEKEDSVKVNGDDLLLKLNLVAVQAARTTDLRFLDALNYYYELPRAVWPIQACDDSLMASYHALYAQALAAWI